MSVCIFVRCVFATAVIAALPSHMAGQAERLTARHMTRALGWEKYRRPESEFLFTMPSTTVNDLAAAIRKRLESPTLRVVGDPQMKITQVAFAPGFAGFPAHVQGHARHLRRRERPLLVTEMTSRRA
jgi:hypothetical protein